jgi:hypothetical protein
VAFYSCLGYKVDPRLSRQFCCIVLFSVWQYSIVCIKSSFTDCTGVKVGPLDTFRPSDGSSGSVSRSSEDCSSGAHHWPISMHISVHTQLYSCRCACITIIVTRTRLSHPATTRGTHCLTPLNRLSNVAKRELKRVEPAVNDLLKIHANTNLRNDKAG